MRTKYSEQHKSQKVAANYDLRYSSRTLLLQQQFEIGALTDITNSLMPKLICDVATGTGRITEYLMQIGLNAEIYGVDNSENMLRIAKRKNSKVKFLRCDFSDLKFGEKNALQNRFDLVTCFRFYANSDDREREEATIFIQGILKSGGHVIINNHCNSKSPSMRYFSLRSRGKIKGAKNSDLKKAFNLKGFQLVKVISYGIPIQDENKFYLMADLSEFSDQLLLKKHLVKHEYGINTILVFKKI